MANTLSKIGIASGSKVEAWHVTQSIDAFTGEQAYDITLSGSLTVTGSVTLTQPIDVNFYGTASTSNNSLYSDHTGFTDYAVTTSYAYNETVCLQFQHVPENIIVDTAYYFGSGNITTIGSFDPESALGLPATGIIAPFGGTILYASVTSTCLTTGSVSGDLIMGFDNYGTFEFTNLVRYDRPMNSFDERINKKINAGDRIMFLVSIKNGALNPTKVVHNINLYILADHA